MKRYFKLTAMLMALLLLAGCSGAGELSVAYPVPVGTEMIAYLPLDDRPDNVERVRYLAQSLGYELCMPAESAYITRLNSAEGSVCGDRAMAYEWLLQQEKNGCDRYIIFLDQLLSGGLVNSRCTVGSDPVTLSDGTVLTEEEMLQNIIELLAADENNRVWLLDTVMRLAPTVGYRDWTNEDYSNIRGWCAESRLLLPADELNAESITANYRIGSDGSEIIPADFDADEVKLSECLRARERKLRLTEKLFAGVGDQENFRIICGIDDSSDEYCIQANEIAYITQLLREGDALLSGVDDLAFKAVSSMYLADSGWAGGEIAVHYFGGRENEHACAYDYRPLTELVREHEAFYSLTESDNAELQLFVMTAPADESKKAEYIGSIVQAVKESLAANLPAILMDTSNTAYGQDFRNALVENVELGKLIAYTGLLDMAICTGTAFSHGVARYACLENGGYTEYMARGFMQSETDVILKDMAYRTLAINDAMQYVDSRGSDHSNFTDAGFDRAELVEFTADKLESYGRDVLKNLEGSGLIVSLDPYAEMGWSDIGLSNYRFPWNRTFEFTMDIAVGTPTEK